MPIPLLALAISAFAIGTTEFVIMGLLPQVAQDLAVSLQSQICAAREAVTNSMTTPAPGATKSCVSPDSGTSAS